MAANLNFEQAYALLQSGAPLNGNGFSLLGSIARLAISDETTDQARDLLIRLLERQDTLNETERPLLDALVSRLGLYPYVMNPQNLSGAEQIAFEYHRPQSLESENFVFHAMQQEVFQRLLDGDSIVLSAPTSFGKSVITDALVATGQWQQIAIVVPTLALIDETRRRLARFANRYKINTFPGQEVAPRTLFIMTQERLLELEPFPAVSLFIIDEFYKLDSESDPERGTLLNIAWDRLLRTGAQYYLTGPNVTGLADALPRKLRESLLVTEFKTVAVDQVDVPPGGDERERLLHLCSDISGQTLIYCRTPARVRQVGKWLIDDQAGSPTPASQVAGSWVANNYDSEWIAARCLKAGIGLHHARIPRAMQHHTVRLFNSGDLRFLICTSTLIEGVNTTAQNVLVLDALPYRRPLDYFTFSNIRGRAGRMFRHFVGHVYLFGGSPAQTQTTIDIPISSQSRKASTAALLQLPPDELSRESWNRVAQYYDQGTLSIDTLKANKGIDPERQLAVAQEIIENIRYWNSQLAWTGIPNFDQTVAVSQLMLSHLVLRTQRGQVSARSLATRLGVIRRAQGSVPEMVEAQLRYSTSRDRDEAVEDVLFFNRNWTGHLFPSALMTIERIQAEVFRANGLRAGSYAFYAQEVERQFLPPYFVTLEEYGLPTVVALKLRSLGLVGDSLDDVLGRLRVVAANPRVAELLDSFEQQMLDEVVAGLGPQ
jgi:hypothetical protein